MNQNMCIPWLYIWTLRTLTPAVAWWSNLLPWFWLGSIGYPICLAPFSSTKCLCVLSAYLPQYCILVLTGSYGSIKFIQQHYSYQLVQLLLNFFLLSFVWWRCCIYYLCQVSWCCQCGSSYLSGQYIKHPPVILMK